MILPFIVRELTEYIQNIGEKDFTHGVYLLLGSCLVQLSIYYVHEHMYQINLITGYMAK